MCINDVLELPISIPDSIDFTPVGLCIRTEMEGYNYPVIVIASKDNEQTAIVRELTEDEYNSYSSNETVYIRYSIECQRRHTRERECGQKKEVRAHPFNKFINRGYSRRG